MRICWHKATDFLVRDYDKIINIDTQWFGNYLKESNNLVNIKGDVEILMILKVYLRVLK